MEAKTLLTPKNLSILNEIETLYKHSKISSSFFKWFLAITQIHHPTFQCSKIAEKICFWLEKMCVLFENDEHNNILVRIKASDNMEKCEVLGVQCHIDMVWVEKEENKNIENINNNKENIMSKINVEFIQNYLDINGKNINVLISKNSTLGADNGFGVALCLDIIENKDKYIHGPLEIIFTSDEEQGLIGAKHLPKKGDFNGKIKPFNMKYLINTDSLDGNKVYIGCAGCEIFNYNITPSYKKVKEGIEISIKLKGFMGGHSGKTIHKGQANPIKWIIYILNILKEEKVSYSISHFIGGQAMNAIPNNCECSFIVEENKKFKCENVINKALNELKEDYQNIEKNIDISIEYNILSSEKNVISQEDSLKIIYILSVVRHGILKMHNVFTDCVDSSLNLAQISLKFPELNIQCLSRSSSNSEFDQIHQYMLSISNLLQIPHKFSYEVGSRPWPPNTCSKLAEIIKSISKEKLNIKLENGLSQVTVESPVFNTYLGYNDVDIVSICPSIPLAHCVGEYIDVEEMENFRIILIETLKNIL